MKKSEFKPGMFTLRTNSFTGEIEWSIAVKFNGQFLLIAKDGYMRLDDYDDDLKSDLYSIQAVYSGISDNMHSFPFGNGFNTVFSEECYLGDLLWKREKIAYTKQQIADKLQMNVEDFDIIL